MNRQNRPRPTPLDSVEHAIAATGFIRENDGTLSAERVAKLYGVSAAELSEWLGCPDAETIQAALSYFERVARLLAVVPEADFRRWLRAPNPNLSNEPPLVW